MTDVFVTTFNLDFVAPTIENRVPAPGAVGVALAADITFSVLDDEYGAGVDVATIDASVDGVPALVGGVFQAGFTGSLTPVADGYDVVINPDADFNWNAVVEVTASASDLAEPANASGPVTWSFAVLTDVVAPTIENRVPAPGAVGVLTTAGVSFDVIDNVGGSGVDVAQLLVTVNGVPALIGSVFQAGFTGSVTAVGDGYAVVVTPATPFALETSPVIYVEAQDLSTPPNEVTATWSFDTVEDLTGPVILNETPAEGVIADLGTTVSFDVVDPETGVDVTTLSVTLNGAAAITAGILQPGYAGSITPIADGYAVVIIPDVDLRFDVDVLINVTNLSIVPDSTIASWSFFVYVDVIAPTIVNRNPAPGAIDVALATSISFDIVDDVGGSGVDLAQTLVTIDGVNALIGSVFQPGFTGLITPIADGYSFVVTPGAPFAWDAQPVVYVAAQDLWAEAPNEVEATWSFAVLEDLTGPVITNLSPANGAEADVDPPVSFDVTDPETGVDLSTLTVVLNGAAAVLNGVAQPDYTLLTIPIADGYSVIITFGTPLQYDIDGVITVANLSTVPDSTEVTWSFFVPVPVYRLVEICNPAPLLPVEIRLRTAFPTPGLDALRRGVLGLISRDDMLDHRIRGLLLTAHQTDLAAALADVTVVPSAILAERVCKQRPLFELDRDVAKLDLALHSSWLELRRMGISESYADLLETRSRSASPQQRVGAACATLLFASALLIEPPLEAVPTVPAVVEPPVFVPETVAITSLPPVSDGAQVLSPLLPVELRLLSSFVEPGLEALRKGVLQAVSRDESLERRARAVLLTAYANDMRIMFADLLDVPQQTQAETIAKRRRLFEVDADLRRLRQAIDQSLRELYAQGLSQGYVDLISTRINSTTPQYRISGTCALLLFASILGAPAPAITAGA